MILKAYILALTTFLAIDMLWLGVVAKDMYRQQLGHLLSSSVQWVPALVFYALFVGGLLVFVILPALEKGSWTHALTYGALFGFIAYATYDLTNLATLKGWPLVISGVDMVWGACLAGSVSVITYLLVTKV